MARDSKRKRDEKRFGKPERLADIIHSGSVWAPDNVKEVYGDFTDFVSARFMADFSLATHIDAQNVFDFCEKHYQGKVLDFHRDVPNYMPPFNPVFVEFQQESLHGLLVQCFEGEGFPPVPDELVPFRDMIKTNFDHIILCEHVFNAIKNPAWKTTGPLATFICPISRTGQLTEDPIGNVCYSNKMTDEQFRVARSFGYTAFFPAMLAISFMHCKNVSTNAVDPDQNLNRVRRKAGLKPFLRYHTINIEPMKTILRTEGGIEANGLKKALHICRGHFSTYTEDRPLFGKHSGTFWVPSHVRGSANEGVIISDYNIKAPTEG